MNYYKLKYHLFQNLNQILFKNPTMKLVFLLLLTISIASSTPCEDRLHFLPMPKIIKCNDTNPKQNLIQDPCKIIYQVKNQNQLELQHFKQLIQDQHLKTFKCKIANIIFGKMNAIELTGFKYKLIIEVENTELKSVFTTKEQSYKLNITAEQAQLAASTFVGMVRGLETFLQTFECPRYKYKQCVQKMLPIEIEDQPAYVYRGLMVDTSRHFLPMHLLYETVDALMYNKMNVFHWHITDEDAFPLILDSHPQIAQYGAFSEEQTYTSAQARQLVRYAMVRGVRVIPQLDTPGHAASWGKAPQNAGVACRFGNNGYMGPLDVTLQQTYKLVKEVFAEIIDIFPDPIVHLGGDQVQLACSQNKTEFVKLENISGSDSQIERHYRRKQHKIIKELDPTKTPMYWMNSAIQVEESDIVHWWGQGNPQTPNPTVISNYGPLYLDMGVGNYFASSYGNYLTWLDLHNQRYLKNTQDLNAKTNVIGAEVCLWSQINNRYTHHMKIWIRSSSFAERVWNTKDVPSKPWFFGRLTAHERLMNRRGIPTAPATCQQCETNPEFC